MKQHRTRALALALAIGLVPMLGACNRDADDAPAGDATTTQILRVAGVDVGRSIGPDRRITDTTDDFRPGDTIYVSVRTEGGPGGGTLSARWTFEDGQVVEEGSQSVSSGASVTEFHISQPAGLPVGSYSVEISLDGRTVETEDFEVR